LGISTDGLETHERWLATSPGEGGLGGLNFPLASDEDGAVCQSYGVYVERQHLALRGLFIIDPNGVLQFQVVHSLSVGRSSEEVLRVLEGLQLGGLCPGERQRGQAPLDAAQELGPNRVVGSYRVEATVGRGAVGTVFRARDLTLQRTVALKVLRPGSSVPATSLLAEARAAAALNHPNVCIIYAVDESGAVPMIVMEYVEGRALSQLLEGGALSREQATGLAWQIAQGMAAAHAQAVVHADLKPANIMVTPAGTAKIMDFGLAHRRFPAPRGDETAIWSPTPAGGISGTPAYMAPEQALGQPATPASDVFSFGLIIYEMVTGQRLRGEGDVLELLHQINREVDLSHRAAETPEPFAEILRQALVVDPNERRISMGQIAERLKT
jgi:serine/threonine protein kinase